MSPHKMCNRVSFIVFVVAALFNIRTGHGLKCYSCDTVQHPHCKDPFIATDTAVIDCKTSCLKADGYFGNGTFISTFRRCSDSDCDGKYQFTRTAKEIGITVTGYCYYCSVDLCNSAPASSQISSLAIVVPLATFFFEKIIASPYLRK